MPYTPPPRITVDAQPNLRLRSEPEGNKDNVITRLADKSVWPVVGVAREKLDPQSNVLWVQVAATDASGQPVTGYCHSDFVTPRPDALPNTQQVSLGDTLKLRRTPVRDATNQNMIVSMSGQSVVTVLGGAWEDFDPASGKWWFYVEYKGQRGYAYSRYLVDVVAVQPGGGDLAAGSGLSRPSPAWKFGACLAGVGNSDRNTWHEPTFQSAIEAARVEAVKLVPLNDQAKMSKVYSWLRSKNMAFVMVRLTWKPRREWANLPRAERMDTAVNDFMDTVRNERQLELAYDNGVRYFEVHNEPNITANPTDPDGDGLGTAWMEAGEFAEWFSRVADQLRQIHSDIFLGFPGLSPQQSEFPVFNGQEVTANGKRLKWQTDFWLSACKPVIDEKADWIGVHCYWSAEGAQTFGLDDPNSTGGMGWKQVKARFPGKLLFITEFSNNKPLPPDADRGFKGTQYAQYIAKLRNEKAIGAAFAYSIYWQQDPYSERWVYDDPPGKYRLTSLPGELGKALQANALTAEMKTVASPAVWA